MSLTPEDKRKLLVRLTLAFSIAIFTSFALASYSLATAHRNACESRNITLSVMGDLLIAARYQTDHDPTVPPEKVQQSDAFVLAAIRRIDEARC